MKTMLLRIAEKNGFILYQRQNTRPPGYVPIPKYLITGNDHYDEFCTERQAQKTFKQLTQPQ